MDVLGRDAELARIDAWLSQAGQAGLEPAASSLVIDGQPGIGKTTLWAETIRRARQAGWQVLSCRPAPSDAGMSHVGLADLLRTVADADVELLPPPQRRSLEVALLRADAGDGDLEPRAVGTGLTSLLALLAGRGKLIVAVDDVQWLDVASARALGFAMRRLADQPVRVIAAARVQDPGRPTKAGQVLFEPGGADHLVVGPLTIAAIHQLFRQVLGASFARPVLVSIHRAAGGNPFYALEIGREIHRLGAPSPGQPLPVPADLGDLALLRLRRLPKPTRDVLALVAAMPRAAAAVLDSGALAPAERAAIVRMLPDGRVEFTHPLFGSVLYASLPEAARRALHGELAARAAGPEERARHLALSAAGPDESTAAALDHAARDASARGAADIAVELKELACRLTPPQDRQALIRRRLELADRRYFAGDPNGARRELEQLLQELPAGEDRARVLLELGSVLWALNEWRQGEPLLIQALEEAHTDALRAQVHSRISALDDDCDVSVQHGEAALALIDKESDPLLYSFALHNVALFKLYSGRGADHAAIAEGMRLQQEAAAWEMSTVPAFWARAFDDFGTARRRFEDVLRVFAERGDEANAAGILSHLAVIEALTGNMARARELAAEAVDLAEQTEQETFLIVAQWAQGQVCARAGDTEDALAAGNAILARLQAHPDDVLEGMARAVLGLAALTAGDLASADRHLTRSDEITTGFHAREPASGWFHGDHAEAVIGLGDTERAETLVQRLEARAVALPRPWSLAVSARCRGLLNAARGSVDAALADYQRALAAHQALDMPAEKARTLLALGRLYRRRNERQRSREALTEAIRCAESAGAAGWAAAARGDLARISGRRGEPDELTPTERQVAELAASGLRNHEIAARLFLSGKTVESNLSRCYRKLGIRSRAELARRLGDTATGSASLTQPPGAIPGG